MWPRASLLGALWSLVLAGSLAAEPPVDPATPPAPQTLSAASARTDGVVLEAGGGRYTLASGRLWWIEASNSQAIGLFFEGRGSLAWSADDANAARVYGENARRVGGLRAGRDRTLAADFAQAAFYFSKTARPEVNATFSSEETASPAGGLDALRRRFGRDRRPAPETSIAAAGSERYVEVLVAADKDVRHVVDDAFAGEETLSVVEPLFAAPSGFPDWRFAVPVAARPRGRTRREAPRPSVRLVEVEADVRETGQDRGHLDVSETLRFERAVETVAFELASDTLTSRLHSILPTSMESVSGEDGQPLPFVLEKDRLFVFLRPPARAGQTMKLRFRYDGAFFERIGGNNFWELPQASSWSRQPSPLSHRGAWYPRPISSGFIPAHTFRATVRARKPLTPFATGDTVRRGEDGDWNLVETRMDRPVRSVTVLAGTYTIQERTVDGVTCRVASYGIAKGKAGARMLDLFHEVRRFYESYFGRFPWKEYALVDAPAFDPVGQASPGMTRVPWGINNFFHEGFLERLAHDVAHSWWGDSVWGAQPADRWIDEAFAEVAGGRAIEVLVSGADFSRLRNIWKARARDAKGRAPIPLAGDLTERLEYTSSSDLHVDRYVLLYFKGASLLQTIRDETGDRVFFTLLQRFLASSEGSPEVTTSRFVELLNEATKKDWGPWFEKYYYGFELP